MKSLTLKDKRGIQSVAVIAVVLLTTVITAPARAADTNPVVPINLVAPSGLPDIPALPFTGVKSAVFQTPSTMLTLGISPSQGFVGTPITISGKGLPANASLPLTWSTLDGTWVTDIQPNSVNYLGTKYTKYNVDIVTVTTDANGAFSYKTKAPVDFGGIHDIYALKDGVAVAHGGFQMGRTFTMSPKSGPVGTPITITYTGMGASLYTAGADVHWDQSYAGELQALWTRGYGKVVIRASGAVGNHFVQVQNALTYAYLNVLQSPIPFTNKGIGVFKVTADNGAPKPYITWPAQVESTIALRTTLSSAGLDPNTKAVATLSKSSGAILTKSTFKATGLSTTGTHQLVWSTVVGNRVNCTGTCWNFSSIPLGTVNVTGSSVSTEFTVPDNLGGWHVVQLKQGDVIEAQAAFYVKHSIMAFYDKAGKVIGMGLAKADNSGSIEAFAKGGAGAPATSFKSGEEFTISIKGVGWTQLDNTMGVTYDNAYVGYGCGFNSNGYMVIHLTAMGAPGTHIIDLHPILYTQQPSFANTPYGMVPILSGDRDFAGLALGYTVPSIHFAITVTK